MNETDSSELTVNGQTHTGEVEDRKLLLDFLREDLGLTGTHAGCEQGACGACTVLFDGLPARSCLILARQAQGHSVLTIEGLQHEERLHPMQKAFCENFGFQCGFCTPGMILTAISFVRENGTIDETGAREAISGNICRCTGYADIVSSVVAGSLAMHAEGRGEDDHSIPR
jgi:carbon-monoxide dehydrogenase small subunit